MARKSRAHPCSIRVHFLRLRSAAVVYLHLRHADAPIRLVSSQVDPVTKQSTVIWLRITNESEYRGWNTRHNGVKRQSSGTATGYFGAVGAPQWPAPQWIAPRLSPASLPSSSHSLPAVVPSPPVSPHAVMIGQPTWST